MQEREGKVTFSQTDRISTLKERKLVWSLLFFCRRCVDIIEFLYYSPTIISVYRESWFWCAAFQLLTMFFDSQQVPIIISCMLPSLEAITQYSAALRKMKCKPPLVLGLLSADQPRTWWRQWEKPLESTMSSVQRFPFQTIIKHLEARIFCVFPVSPVQTNIILFLALCHSVCLGARSMWIYPLKDSNFIAPS